VFTGDSHYTSKSHRTRGAIVAVVFVAIALVGFLLFVLESSGPSPPTILVSGTVATSGEATQATTVTFTSFSGSETIVAVNIDGQYSAYLPDHNGYSVSVEWQGSYPWQKGNVSAAVFSLNQGALSPSTFTENINAETPNSVVTVQGDVQTEGLGTHPLSVDLTSNGEEFSAQASGGTYSVKVANLATYTAQIQWQGIAGVQGFCEAGTVVVEGGPGMVSGTENLSC
jgi:hypothetical protein